MQVGFYFQLSVTGLDLKRFDSLGKNDKIVFASAYCSSASFVRVNGALKK